MDFKEKIITISVHVKYSVWMWMKSNQYMDKAMNGGKKWPIIVCSRQLFSIHMFFFHSRYILTLFLIQSLAFTYFKMRSKPSAANNLKQLNISWFNLSVCNVVMKFNIAGSFSHKLFSLYFYILRTNWRIRLHISYERRKSTPT